jgi:hypothetical protein
VICIIFKLKREVPASTQDRLLETVKHWDRDNRAGRLHFEATDKEERSICYVYVANDTAAKRILKRLHETNEVEYAHIPPSRQVAETSY